VLFLSTEVVAALQAMVVVEDTFINDLACFVIEPIMLMRNSHVFGRAFSNWTDSQKAARHRRSRLAILTRR